MATAAEQWVLVEMVQALYEVSLTARAAHDHTRPCGGGTGLVDLWSESWAGLAGSCPDPWLLWLEGLAGEARAGAGTKGLLPGSGRKQVGGGAGAKLVLKNQSWD